jgi:hypothetical protein
LRHSRQILRTGEAADISRGSGRVAVRQCGRGWRLSRDAREEKRERQGSQ